MKNILLTGASGTVGYEVLKQLSAREDFRLTVFDVETPAAKKKFSKIRGDFKIIYGDITNTADVENAVKGMDAVIHLAAIIPPLADDKPELAEKVNVAGTDILIRSLEKNAPQAFLLYSSSISVYGDRLKNPDIRVGDPLIPSEGDAYAVTKIKTEQRIRESRLDWTVFRLSAIMGNHKISKLMFHMPLDTKMEICTPEDTARAFVHALEHRQALNGKIFNLGGGPRCRLTYREFLTESFRIFGLGRLDFPAKAFAEKNFHCGYYTDGDDLENIVHFRRDGLQSYFAKVEKSVNPAVRIATKLVSPMVKKILVRQSEPLQALKHHDQKNINRFYENTIPN